MPQFVWVIDTTLVAMVYIFAVAGTLGWVFHSAQRVVRRGTWTIVAISSRLGFLFVVLLLFSAVNNVASWVTLLVAALPFVISLTGGNYAAIGCMAIVYLIQQFVLGFPDRNEWVLESEPTAPSEADPLDAQVGKQFTLTTALRPSGHVFIDEQKVPCESEDGCFVEAGTEVIVRRTTNGRLVVRRVTNR